MLCPQILPPKRPSNISFSQRLDPTSQKEHEACHRFIQEASTKSYTDSVEIMNHIARILRVGESRGRGRAVVEGHGETFMFMFRLKQCRPVDFKQLMVYPGD